MVEGYRLGEPYQRPRRKGLKVLVLLCALMAITILPALAARGGGGGKGHGGSGGGSGGTSCTQSAPRASVDNSWAWASKGSWGMPGQKLTYAIDVFNNDVGCGSSTFAVEVSAPDGFDVSIPTNTITLASSSTGYVWASVTSPVSAADGDYALTATVRRAGSSDPAGTDRSYYKVYSSDTTAPKLFWENPKDGATVTGRSVNVGFGSSDDHAVKRLEIILDGTSVASVICDNISSSCQASYAWSIGRAGGQHTATYKSVDWMDNVASETVTFTVS